MKIALKIALKIHPEIVPQNGAKEKSGPKNGPPERGALAPISGPLSSFFKEQGSLFIMNNNNNNNNNVNAGVGRKKKAAPRRSQRQLVVPNAECPYDVCPAGRGNCQADELHTCFGENRCTNVSATTLEQCDAAEVINGNCTAHFKKNVIDPLKAAAKLNLAFKKELDNARQKLRNAQAKKRHEELERQKRVALERQQELLEERGLRAEDFSYKKRVDREEDYEPAPVLPLSSRLRKRARDNRDQDGDADMQDPTCPVCNDTVDDSTPSIACMQCDERIHLGDCMMHHGDSCN